MKKYLVRFNNEEKVYKNFGSAINYMFAKCGKGAEVFEVKENIETLVWAL